MNLARWRDSEMARREERDGEMVRWRDGFFLQREKEEKRKRGKEKKSLIQTMLSKQIVQLYLLHYKE